MAIYQDIASVLEQEIGHQFRPGDYLPSEHELADRFQVNRHTLRRAVDNLILKGLVLRQHGRGMMITGRPIDYPIHNRSCYTENLAEQGKILETEVLSCTLIKKRFRYQSVFSDNTCQLVHIRTLRTIDEFPVSVIDHYLDLSEHINVLKSFDHGSLHSFIKLNLGIPLGRGKTLLRAKMPSNEDARTLLLGHGIPVVRVETQNHICDPHLSKICVELSISINRADLFQYSLEPGS